MRTILATLTAALLLTLAPLRAGAQDNARSMEEPFKFDLGLAMGMAGYWGDLSSNMFRNPGIAATAIFHYRFDTRWSLRGAFTGATLSGSNAKEANVLPGGVYEFSAGYYALDARAEFNFFNFGIGETYKRLRRVTPYLAVGVGGELSCSGGKTAFAPTIPMAFGVRYKVAERFNLGAEWCFTKVFGDKVDGLTDLTGIKTDMIRHTDWVSTLQVYFTVEFGRRCTVCNRSD